MMSKNHWRRGYSDIRSGFVRPKIIVLRATGGVSRSKNHWRRGYSDIRSGFVGPEITVLRATGGVLRSKNHWRRGYSDIRSGQLFFLGAQMLLQPERQ